MNREKLREELIRDEGYRQSAYRDSVQLWTVGIGHLLPATSSGDETWSAEQIEQAFEHDVDAAEKLAIEVFGPLAGLDDARQRALVNLCFNLGNRIKTFEHFIRYARDGRWTLASIELETSKWFRQVQRERSARIVQQIREGGE